MKGIKNITVIVKGDYASGEDYVTAIVKYEVYDPSEPDLVKSATLDGLNQEISSETLAETLLSYLREQKSAAENQEGL